MSRSLGESRLIRFSLITMGAIALVQAAALALTWWISWQAVVLAASDKAVPNMLQAVAEALAGVVGGAGFATVATALIARYGAREATRNLGHNGAEDVRKQ